jgi:cell division septation protein DedD
MGAGGAGAVGTGATGAGAARPGSFGIQLGAFGSEAAANNEWRLLTGRFAPQLQGLQEHVVPADTPSGRVYRLQAVVGDEARARGICDSLRKQAQGCVAVLPH